MGTCILFALISSLFGVAWSKPSAIPQSSLEEIGFVFNEDNRSTENVLIHQDNEKCSILVHKLNDDELYKRQVITIPDSLYNNFFVESKQDDNCALACIDVGVDAAFIHTVFPERFQYISNDSNSISHEWYRKECQAKELGAVVTLDHDVQMYWIHFDTEERVDVGIVKPGERNTFWVETFLGHSFLAVDTITKEELGRYYVRHDSFYQIGPLLTQKEPDYVPAGYRSLPEAVHSTFEQEWSRSRAVKRTFSSVGFDRGTLPLDLFSSMSSYYYNNKDQFIREEWNSKGLFVNWWEVDSHYLPMPWNRKKYWQKRLLTLVEAWSNTTLELTDIYGLRKYNEGARLLSHVDRTSTHAASLIINIAQENVEVPWPVEIYDHGDRLHEVPMKVGDIVYYESARCLHGRMRPLAGKGSFYVNLFAHYRPNGDPDWSFKPTPEGHARPIGRDLTTVDVNKTLPFLSPSREVLRSGEDLFKWWKHVAPKPVANDEL